MGVFVVSLRLRAPFQQKCGWLLDSFLVRFLLFVRLRQHTDHDAVTEKCSKMVPGRKPCPCTGYSVRWVCNCGHPASEHETVVVDANSTSTFSRPDLAREWVCGGVRPEIKNEVGADSTLFVCVVCVVRAAHADVPGTADVWLISACAKFDKYWSNMTE